MDLAAMRTAFKEHTSRLADTVSNADVDALLNNYYTNVLPAEIDGKLHEVMWTQTLVVGTNPVVIPRHILSFPTGLFWVQGTAGVLSGTRDQLSFYDDAAIFIRNYPDYLDPTKPGRPTAVYRQGRNLYLDYIPDATYNLIALARGSQLSALPSGGLDSYPHAMAVVTGAAWDYLLGKEDEAGVMREAAQFSVFRSLLYVESHGDYAGRTPGRSF